jgi:hypothetical protein
MLWSTTAVWSQVAPLGCQCATVVARDSPLFRKKGRSSTRNLGKQAKSEALAWQLAFATQACRSHLILGAIAKRTPPTWHAQLHCIRDGASKLVEEKKRTTTQQQLSLTRRGRQMMARLAATWPSSSRLEYSYSRHVARFSVLFRPSACPSVLICFKKTELGRPHCPCKLQAFTIFIIRSYST